MKLEVNMSQDLVQLLESLDEPRLIRFYSAYLLSNAKHDDLTIYELKHKRLDKVGLSEFELLHLSIQSPEGALFYALFMKGTGYERAEKIILTSAKVTYLYMLYVLKKRWPKGEHVISQDPSFAVKFAIHCLNRRWHYAETLIQTDDTLWRAYKSHFKADFS